MEKSSAVPDAFSGLDLRDQLTTLTWLALRGLLMSFPTLLIIEGLTVNDETFNKEDFSVVNAGNFVVPSCFLFDLPEVSHCTREEMLREPGGAESWTLSWEAPTSSLPPICFYSEDLH